jgi:hypothetical protein
MDPVQSIAKTMSRAAILLEVGCVCLCVGLR